jgi:hypothetical protein
MNCNGKNRFVNNSRGLPIWREFPINKENPGRDWIGCITGSEMILFP